MNYDSDLDEAILLAALPDHNLQKQLQSTLLWNHPDLAEKFVLSKSSTWRKQDFEKATIMALALDCVTILELLLNYGVSVQSILNKNLLEFLYGYRALVQTNCSTMKYEENDYVEMNIKEREKVSELWSFNEHEEYEVCIISKWLFHTGLNSSGITSSQLRPLSTKSCRSIFIAAVIGVIFSVKSNISATLETQCLLVNFSGI